jgi:cell division initiation protein
MKITPLDVSQKQFRRVLRGYDRHEVEAFLSLVSSELEDAVKEVNALRQETRRKDETISELRGRERALQETLISAQKASEEIRESARKEAEISISEAELQAEKIVQAAHGRFLRIVDDINELKRQRVQFEAGVRMLVDSHLKLLNAFQEPERQEAIPFIGPSKRKAADEA